MAKKYEIQKSADGGKDRIVISGKAENDSQAQAKAQSSLKDKNKEKITGSFSVPGNPKLVAGMNIELTGIGAFSGKWYIVSSTHTVDTGSGYVTDVEIRKL